VNDADPDWPNIAEKIESVGHSERAALFSHIGNALEHLIKLEASRPTEAPGGWQDTIVPVRGDIECLLEDSPSLRPAVDKRSHNESARTGQDDRHWR
jgi:hypothetical protein